MMSLAMGTGLLGVGLMILIWAGLVGLAVWLVKLLFPRAGNLGPVSLGELSATEILARRYARGEISPEEYQSMKGTLET